MALAVKKLLVALAVTLVQYGSGSRGGVRHGCAGEGAAPLAPAAPAAAALQRVRLGRARHALTARARVAAGARRERAGAAASRGGAARARQHTMIEARVSVTRTIVQL